MVYCASSRALAALELLVHFDLSEAPTDLVSIGLEMPESLVESLEPSDRPADWAVVPAPDSTRDYGSRWLRERRSVGLRVPSVVIPDEWNVLLNPQHSEFDQVSVGTPKPFHFDPRLFEAKTQRPNLP